MHIHSQPITPKGEMTGVNSFQFNPSFTVICKTEQEAKDKIDSIITYIKDVCDKEKSSGDN